MNCVGGLAVAVFALLLQPKQVSDAIADLRSQDRDVRLAAIKIVAAQPSLPVSACESLLDFARTEIKAALTDVVRAPRDNKNEVPLLALPKAGNEVPLSDVKADPAKYKGKRIVVTGVAELADYWNFGYLNAEESHVSIRLQEVDGKLQPQGDPAYVYCQKKYSYGLGQRLNVDKSKGGVSIPLRATVMIDPSRYQGAKSWQHLELLDFQLLTVDKKRWQAPAFEGMEPVQVALSKCDKEAIPFLVKTFTSSNNNYVESLVKDVIHNAFLRMSRPDKQAVIVQLKQSIASPSSRADQRRVRYTIRALEVSNRSPPKNKK